MTNNSIIKESIWLIIFFIDRDKATYDTIKEKWEQRFRGETLYKEKFRRRKISIEHMFDIVIRCDKDEFHYFLDPKDKKALQCGARERIMGSLIAGEWLSENSKHLAGTTRNIRRQAKKNDCSNTIVPGFLEKIVAHRNFWRQKLGMCSKIL